MRGNGRKYYDVFLAAGLRQGSQKGRLPDGSFDRQFLVARRETIELIIREECFNAVTVLRHIQTLQSRNNLSTFWDDQLRGSALINRFQC